MFYKKFFFSEKFRVGLSLYVPFNAFLLKGHQRATSFKLVYSDKFPISAKSVALKSLKGC